MEAAEYLECERRQIHVMCEKGRAITQITLDDDYNLAEYKPDILKIIEDKGQVRMEEVKVESDLVRLRGALHFEVLYRSNGEDGYFGHLQGEIPFQENVRMEGAAIPYAFEGRKRDITILCELFVQVYNCFESEEGADKKEIEQIIYWFFHDYSEIFVEQSVREMLDPSLDFFTKIVMESDLNDLSYLYRYGEYISSSELQVAEYLNSLSEEQIQSMADTYTEGYRIGFEVTGKDLGK